MRHYLAAVILHERGRNVNMMSRPDVLSGLLKDGSTRLDTFCSSGKLHVLDINLSAVAQSNQSNISVV